MALSTRTADQCLRALGRQSARSVAAAAAAAAAHTTRFYSEHRPSSLAEPEDAQKPHHDGDDAQPNAAPTEPGPMARRLEEATEEAMFTGGRAGRRAVEDAGFSEELKNRLLSKLADAKFQDEHQGALREAGLVGNIPEAAGTGTRDLAAAQPWTGEETQSDAVLRMLHDAHKPLAPGLRGKAKAPLLASIPADMRLKRQPPVTAGRKVANAKQAAGAYADWTTKDRSKGLTEHEREAMRKELRERFAPAARALPNTLSGLAALANERIEDAIARGQFKNIPRGKGITRDARADNPFIDTTEYIMNKMIKQQDIVPPWIEKQQEVVKAAEVFRGRLRNDWKRHAARMIASRGGSLEEQMRRAQEYSQAEAVHNPRRRNSDQVTVPTSLTEGAVMVAMRQEAMPEPPATPRQETAPAPAEPEVSLVRPFRDPTWEATERSYMELAVSNMNKLTRAYNLMAPELAKKPYFNLERELNACFADVAPQLADEIKERARRPPQHLLNNQGGHRSGRLLDRFARESRSTKVYESKTPHYGLKEMWRDLWQRSA